MLSGTVANNKELQSCFLTVCHNVTPHVPAIQSPASDPCSWNTDVFYSLINEKYQMDWKEVIRNLDYPGFQISQQRGLAQILTLYKRATGEPMPVDQSFAFFRQFQCFQIKCLWSLQSPIMKGTLNRQPLYETGTNFPVMGVK